MHREGIVYEPEGEVATLQARQHAIQLQLTDHRLVEDDADVLSVDPHSPPASYSRGPTTDAHILHHLLADTPLV